MKTWNKQPQLPEPRAKAYYEAIRDGLDGAPMPEWETLDPGLRTRLIEASTKPNGHSPNAEGTPRPGDPSRQVPYAIGTIPANNAVFIKLGFAVDFLAFPPESAIAIAQQLTVAARQLIDQRLIEVPGIIVP